MLHADIGFSVDENADLDTHYELHLPDFTSSFDSAALLVSFLNDPRNVLAGLEGFFTGIEKTAAGIDSIDLPLIGGAPFDDLAERLRELRPLVLGTQDAPITVGSYDFRYDGDLNVAEEEQSLGFWLDDRIRLDEGVVDRVLARIREELFAALDPINDGEFATQFGFRVPLLDEFGAEQFDEHGKLLTMRPNSPDDIELSFSELGLISFNLKFGGTLVDGDIPIEFSAGIPGLNLDIDSTIHTKIDYLMGIGLGLGNMDSSGSISNIDMGVFLDTSGINAAGEEIALDVSATLTERFNGRRNLGLLHDDVDGPTG